MKLAILLFTSIAVSGLHAGTRDSRQGVPSLAQARSMQVRISGVEEDGLYANLPPVLVEIAGASRWVDVWVEAYQGSGEESARGLKLQSKVVVERGAERVINVSGINRLCAEDGTWTIRVMTGTGLDLRSLAQVTFEVARGPEADHVVRPGEKAPIREPGF